MLTVGSASSVKQAEAGLEQTNQAQNLTQLDSLDLVVYLPEDAYGVINIGDLVFITVDSFLGETFERAILRISDEAEFTLKNVQTESGRKSTVYAAKVEMLNPDHKLKSGIPADVEFSIK